MTIWPCPRSQFTICNTLPPPGLLDVGVPGRPDPAGDRLDRPVSLGRYLFQGGHEARDRMYNEGVMTLPNPLGLPPAADPRLFGPQLQYLGAQTGGRRPGDYDPARSPCRRLFRWSMTAIRSTTWKRAPGPRRSDAAAYGGHYRHTQQTGMHTATWTFSACRRGGTRSR